MPTDVIMPQMGESIFEGTITKWLKKAGDTIARDEPLFEISTDKVDAEIPSPAAGVLTEIKVPEGATVQVNTVVAVIDGAASTLPAASSSAPRTREMSPQADMAPPQAVVMPQMGESIFEGTITKWLKKAGDTVAKDEPLFEISTDKVDAEIPSPAAGVLAQIKVPEGATVQVNTVVAIIGGSASAPVATPSGATTPQAHASHQAAPVAPPAKDGRRLRSSPLVRRIAKENQIDLQLVPGTGSESRITKDDMLRYLSQPRAAQTSQAPPPLSGEVAPLTRMRAIIAQRMVESKRISPHVYSVYKIDMTRIARLRERQKAGFEQRHGLKLTFMPFIAAAAVEALRRYPILNASLLDGNIHYHANINLGIAVALEWGLIVPVVKQAEAARFLALARAIHDLAARARSKQLLPEEVQGSTFTLTNSGVFGGEFGTPILNQPESAILAIGGLRKEPVVLTDAEGNDTIAIRAMQNFCLGFDHR
ncbi:MAG TPA: 2-oxo acid dehydrogenase subunit E2, partial [Candidatus Sulfopaludibacter sp.]|nr:2-oxo acid dehydrogenase subunit E2 [Candidatus Sulfopaludibacter sp.]